MRHSYILSSQNRAKSLETLESFTYQGSALENDTSCGKDVRSEMGKASVIFRKWEKTGIVVGSTFRSTMIYFNEKWPSKGLYQNTWQRYWRLVLKITYIDHITSEEVQRVQNIEAFYTYQMIDTPIKALE